MHIDHTICINDFELYMPMSIYKYRIWDISILKITQNRITGKQANDYLWTGFYTHTHTHTHTHTPTHTHTNEHKYMYIYIYIYIYLSIYYLSIYLSV